MYSVINPVLPAQDNLFFGLEGGVLIFGFFILILAIVLKDRRKIIFGFCVLIMALGIWRSYEVFNHRPSGFNSNFISGENLNFDGVVIEEPDRRADFSQYVVKNQNLGRILVKTGNYPEYFYGDILKISGKVETPESRLGATEFNYQSYLAKDNIFSISRAPKITLLNRPESLNFYGHLLVFKKKFISVLDQILPEPKSSFLAALLVGARRTLSDDLMKAFNITGTTHIIAISGYNISIVSIMIMNFLSYLFLPRRLIFWIVIVSLLTFTLIAGAGASVVRAAIMGGLLVLAGREGRFYQITSAIVFAAAVMLFFNPYLLRYDAGFQLSFLAVLGLIYLAPHFNRWFAKLSNFLSFRANLAATLSAQIMTFPIIFWQFDRISLVATLANVLVLPAIPAAMLFGFLGGLAGLLSIKIAEILILPAWFLLSYQIFIVKFLSILPWASI